MSRINAFAKTICRIAFVATISVAFAATAQAQLPNGWVGSNAPPTGIPAFQTPANDAAKLFGSWRQQMQGPDGSVEIELKVASNQTYEIKAIISRGGERMEDRSAGQWRIEGNRLETRSQEGEIESFTFQVNETTLILDGMADGQPIRLQLTRVNVGSTPDRGVPSPHGSGLIPNPNLPQPGFDGQRTLDPPPASSPNLAGTWVFQGEGNGNRVSVELTMAPNSELRVNMLVTTMEGQASINGQGNWSVQGNVLIMKTQLGEERVPFKFDGDRLILDYSSMGFTMEMSRVNR